MIDAAIITNKNIAGATNTLSLANNGRLSPLSVRLDTAAWMSGGVNIESTMKIMTSRYSPLRKLLKKVL